MLPVASAFVGINQYCTSFENQTSSPKNVALIDKNKTSKTKIITVVNQRRLVLFSTVRTLEVEVLPQNKTTVCVLEAQLKSYSWLASDEFNTLKLFQLPADIVDDKNWNSTDKISKTDILDTFKFKNISSYAVTEPSYSEGAMIALSIVSMVAILIICYFVFPKKKPRYPDI